MRVDGASEWSATGTEGRPPLTKPTVSPHVALLRGINVGGKNKLPMKGLAEMFVDAGGQAVRTYIQSGNVVFLANPALVRRIPQLISKAIADAFGFTPPILTRSATELRRVVNGNPFLKSNPDPKTLHVAFLAGRPSPTKVKTLDSRRSPPDAFMVQGTEIYLHYPNGSGRSKLTNAYFDAKLGTVSTVRNWRTVMALVGMMDD